MDAVKCSLMRGPFKPEERKCDWCGKSLSKRRKRWCTDRCSKNFYENHMYQRARRVVRRRDKYRCVKCGSKETIQVNHIIPCIGRHNKVGCWHHQDNLEVLCKVCHHAETAVQRARGDFDAKVRKARKKAARRKRQ